MKRTMIALCVAAALSGATATQLFAQGVERSEAIASSDALSQISMFSYRDGPKSDLLFRGTPLAAVAEGKVQVEYQNDNAQISAEVQDLPKPASLGPYTTYVLWALTPDGRATNQGVIGGIEGGKGQLETQYNASQFALIVTAEPHFAVTIPSTMMVLYNVGDDVKGTESKVATLTERLDYAGAAGSRLSPVNVGEANPVEIVQARYAIAIARAAGADRFSSDAFATANQKLAAAEAALVGDRSAERKTTPGLAREAVIAGEDARRAAVLASTQNATAERQRAATVAATNAANDAARIAATAATATAREATTAAETRAREDATAAATVSREAATAAATASREAATAATAASQAATEVERERAAIATREAATAATAAREAATEVERERAAVAARDALRNRLNEALPTRDSSRGLIAEIGGVQFATGTADANASARESLSKFSGIVASYPELRFNVEGHTDSMGSAAMNQELSLKRATTVRDYLIAQGVPAAKIDVAGLGLSAPIGDNTTTDGRARNRRVEIVVSGAPLTTARL
jgi:outer membrane protein OmpA-like peptidoglycan-associated protein